MIKNFMFGLKAILSEMGVFLSALFYNKMLISFLSGIVVAFLVTGFVLTKNPRHIPIILRHSSVESFQRIANRQTNGTYEMSYSDFVAIYTKTKTLFAVSFVAFCTVLVTVMLTQ